MLNPTLFSDNQKKMSKSTDWAWGNFRHIGQLAVFDDESTEGGYKCKLCKLQLKKRFDTLRKHLKAQHEIPYLSELSENICKIAIICKFCNIPQKTFGQRLKTHMNLCQARRSQEASDKVKKKKKTKPVESEKKKECPKEKYQEQELEMGQDLELEQKKVEQGMKKKKKGEKVEKKKKTMPAESEKKMDQESPKEKGQQELQQHVANFKKKLQEAEKVNSKKTLNMCSN